MDATTMEIEGNGASCCTGAWSFCHYQGSMAARYISGALFLVANLVAWWLRANHNTFFRSERLSGCHGNRDCLTSEAVLIISFTLFLFFLVMFLTTVGTKNIHDRRNLWHSGWWLAKVILLMGCSTVSLLVTANWIQLYGKVARFGAGAFLFIQLISVIWYITRLNSKWCGQNFENHRGKVNTISKLAYGSSMVGIILMTFWYVGCYVNAALVLATAVLVYFMGIVSLLSKDEGFYMEPMLMGVYIVFLCWCAIKSEPKTSSCYKYESIGLSANWLTIISFIGEMICITVAAFSTGTYYKYLQFMNVVESENDVPYGYGFFDFVFATGSINFGMLFLGWETHLTSEKWSVDVSWTSSIIHMVSEGLAVTSFVVVALARYYGIGWLEQLLGKIFGIGDQPHADESHAIELTASGMDNNGPPQESPDTNLERGTHGPPQEHHPTEQEAAETPPQGPQAGTEAVGTETNNAPPPPPSSSMAADLHIAESQSSVIRKQTDEIEEEW